MIRRAVIPAAGFGTRFLPATKVVPKELLPIVDRPALQLIVEELVESGIEEIIFVISPGKEAVANYFTSGGILEETLKTRGQLDLIQSVRNLIEKSRFRAVYQESPQGLGHAVACARDAVGDEPFAVVLPDDLVRSTVPCLKQLIEVFDRDQLSVVALQDVPAEEVHRYGIVGGASKKGRVPFRVTRVVEKPKKEEAPSHWAIIGRYILDPAIFSYLDQMRPGAIGEIQLTDGLAMLAEKKGLMGLPFEGLRIDAGRPPGFLEANLRYAFDDPMTAEALRPVLKELLKS